MRGMYTIATVDGVSYYIYSDGRVTTTTGTIVVTTGFEGLKLWIIEEKKKAETNKIVTADY
jgi:hypothetical protein